MKRIGAVCLFLFLVAAVFGTLLLHWEMKRQQTEETVPAPATNSILIYSQWPQGMAPILTEMAKEKAGISVVIREMTADEMKAAVREGQRAQVYLASQKVLMDLAEAGAFVPHISGVTDTVLTDFKDANGYWTGVWMNPVVFAVNADFMKRNPDFLYSWNDVLQRSNVRLVMLDVSATEFSADGLMAVVEHYGTDEAYRLLAAASSHVVQYAEFLSTPAQMAAMDKCDIGISGYLEAKKLSDDGLPIRWFYPEDGTWCFVYGAALDKEAGEEAVVFLDWLLSDGGRDVKWREAGYDFMQVNAEGLPEDAHGRRPEFWSLLKRYTEGGQKELTERWIRSVRFGMGEPAETGETEWKETGETE